MAPAWLDDAARNAQTTPTGLHRRELLELIALVAVTPACKDTRERPASTPAATGSAPAPGSSRTRPPGALDPASYRTLEAAASRILPADGDFPGARDAKVIDFIDRQLALAPLSKIAPAMIALARALDDAARARRSTELAQLAVAQQDAVIDALSRGTLGTKLPETELFRILHGLVLEGFLCDPHHGGNKDQIAWKAIGFTEPTLRTRGASHDHGKHG